MSKKVITKSLDIVKAKLEKTDEPTYTPTENWETAKNLTDAAFSSTISPQGVDRLKTHYEDLNTQIRSLKKLYYHRENKTTLKQCIQTQNPTWGLLQDKQFLWQSSSVDKKDYADKYSAMTRLSMDTKVALDRLSCADRIKKAADKTFEEIFNKFIKQK